jgi:hypothetical protein
MEQEYLELPYINIDYQIKFDYYNISKYQIYRRAKLYINGAVWGYFSIIGSPFNMNQDSKVVSEEGDFSLPNLIEINIDHPYRNLGFAKLLIHQMLLKIKQIESHIDPYIKLYIDFDITDGFFDFIGATPSYHPYFHKQITFEDLHKL